MKISYDGEGDTLSIILRNNQIHHAEEEGPIITSYDHKGRLVEIEILNASKVMGNFLTAFIRAKPKAKLVKIQI